MNNFCFLKRVFTFSSIVLWLCSSFVLLNYGSWSSFFIINILATLFMIIAVNAAYKEGESSVAA